MRKRYRFEITILVAVLLATLMDYQATHAQDITGFENGYLTFTNDNPSLYYRVEFKPNLTGPVEWDGAFRDLRNIQSSDAEVTVPVGVFYRVVGRDTPWVAGTALADDILSGKTAYVHDEEVTGTMANIGRTNIMPGTSAQAITQGYHDGTGSVAGDADLVAGNIKKDVTIFGVTGTHEGGGGGTYDAAVPKTGQTTSYRTGDDGFLQKGVTWPNPRFTDHGNGTVTDNLTGLMWTKDANLPSGLRTWNQAVDYCVNMNAGIGYCGYNDWRLPNIRELFSLLDFGQTEFPLPAGHPFTNVQGGFYWSSTTYAGSATTVWYVQMYEGGVGPVGKTYSYWVWPVRGGP